MAWGGVAEQYVGCLFFVNTLICTVVMLNLLIAVVSKSFDTIDEKKTQASFREKAGIIAENEYLISTAAKAEWCKPKMSLYYIKEKEDWDDETVEAK